MIFAIKKPPFNANGGFGSFIFNYFAILTALVSLITVILT